MLAIKLKLVGRKNQRTFRVIVQEARAKLGGKNVEDLGWYNPHTNQFKVNKSRVGYWVSNGAQPTVSAAKLLEKVKDSEVGGYEAEGSRKKMKKAKAGGSESATPSASVESASGGESDEVVEKESTESEVTESPAPESAPKEAPAQEAEFPTEVAEPEVIEDKKADPSTGSGQAIEENKED